MPRKVVPIRAHDAEHNMWRQAAADENMEFSPWARKVLNEASRITRFEVEGREAKIREREKMRQEVSPRGTYTPTGPMRSDLEAWRPDPK